MTNEVFINYRNGDGEKIAGLLERDLSHRFGTEYFFRAPKSIPPGATYQEQLINGIRRSSLVMAVIGQDWSRHPALHNENDWVRKEILEAFACGIEVIPVLEGRETSRLNPADLPPALKRLADVQSVRLDMQNLEADLKRIGDQLAAKVPQLQAADRTAPPKPEAGDARNSVDTVHGDIAQAGAITGDVGRIIKGTQGPIHNGKGDIYHNSQHVSGPGGTYVAGDNQGGIRHNFGESRRKEEEDDR